MSISINKVKSISPDGNQLEVELMDGTFIVCSHLQVFPISGEFELYNCIPR